MTESIVANSIQTPPQTWESEPLRQSREAKSQNLRLLNAHPLNQAALRRIQKERLSPQLESTTDPWASPLFLLARHYLFSQLEEPDPESEEAIELAIVMDSPHQQLLMIDNLPWEDPSDIETMTEEELQEGVMDLIRQRLRP